MLALDQRIVVPQHVLELLHACVACSSPVVLVVSAGDRRRSWVVGRGKHRIVSLVEHGHRGYLFVDRCHELLESLEVQAELLDQLSSILLEVHIEKLVPNVVDLVSEGFLCFCSGLSRGAKLSLKSLAEHVLFQVDDLHNLFLKEPEAIPQVLVLVAHSPIDLLLLLRDHQMEVVIARDLTELKVGVGADQ